MDPKDICPPNPENYPLQWSKLPAKAGSQARDRDISTPLSVTTKVFQPPSEEAELQRFSPSPQYSSHLLLEFQVENLLLHVVVSGVEMLQPGQLEHAVGGVSRETRCRTLEGVANCFQPWSKFEQIHQQQADKLPKLLITGQQKQLLPFGGSRCKVLPKEQLKTSLSP